jgi:UPF0755 protein
VLGFLNFVKNPADVNGKEQMVTFSEGMTLKGIAAKLEDTGIIKNRQMFTLWARLKKYSRSIKAGEYCLSPGMTPEEILMVLTRGNIVSHPVTFPEGLSLYQMADILFEKGLGDRESFIAIAESGDCLIPYGINVQKLEGYLYPDTYHFARGLSERAIIDAMLKRFMDVVAPLKEKIGRSGMKLEEVVTLASIVEKETGRASERPVIASVFLNRLKKGMRLESDPTVIYGIRDFSGNLTRRDLREATPYNTYVIRGLPLGPIANPGIESIDAVVNPAETDYLYFVSKNDGSHYFSKTLQEHNRAVMLYQKKKR